VPATFKELCLDTSEGGDALGRFWAAATGCSYVDGDVVGSEEGMGIALCPVPEAKTVKHRVHLDVYARSVDDVLALGATLAPHQDPADDWTVLLDPEGGELCVFLRDDLPPYRVFEVNVDSADGPAIAAWWGEAFGVPVVDRHGFPTLSDVPGMPFEMFLFDGGIPEPKTVKNRWHWDVYGDVEELLTLGATKLWEMPRWTVLADPEGNEFCVF
jgi:hypothetical protein